VRRSSAASYLGRRRRGRGSDTFDSVRRLSLLARRFGLVIVLAGGVIVAYNDPAGEAGDFVFIPALFGIAWLAGFALRTRAEQAEAAEERAALAERERETAARIAVAEERARITRELHDIVAHSVSVMVLQVGAVRYKLPGELAEDKDALGGVEHAGRSALTEMRRLLGAMRDEGRDLELAPQPGLDGLETLAEKVRLAGLPVQVHVEGEPVPLSPAVDLSAYRIVQEGLTNTLKHAGAAHADVTVRYGPRPSGSRCATTASAPRGATASATGSSASVSASRSTAET